MKLGNIQANVFSLNSWQYEFRGFIRLNKKKSLQASVEELILNIKGKSKRGKNLGKKRLLFGNRILGEINEK